MLRQVTSELSIVVQHRRGMVTIFQRNRVLAAVTVPCDALKPLIESLIDAHAELQETAASDDDAA